MDAGGEREAGGATEIPGGGGLGPKGGEYWGFPDGRTKSWFGKDHSPFMLETGFRSWCPEIRAEPANICGWEIGAPLKEAWRKLSSYLTAEVESCPGVELGRIIAEAEEFQLSDSEYGDKPGRVKFKMSRQGRVSRHTRIRVWRIVRVVHMGAIAIEVGKVSGHAGTAGDPVACGGGESVGGEGGRGRLTGGCVVLPETGRGIGTVPYATL